MIGNVVLTELQLKKEALDKLNLPVEVFFGHLGRLELHIPWRNLKSEPVKVIVEDLFLLAGPRVETEYDPVVEEERIQKAKQERLETAEIFQSSVENKLSQDMKNESFTTQLVTKIVDNLQVIVNNIHIRFEDSTSNPQRLFSFGVTLKTLSAVSTDEEWNETFLVNPQEAVHKLVNLDSFSLYWNTREGSMRDLSYEEFVEVARERIGDEEHAYILKPVSGIGKVVLNKFIREGTPKTLLNVLFDAFGINVNYEQYYDILCALAALSTAQRALPYRKYRPAGDGVRPIDLFKFAGTCFQAEIHERNRRRTWAYVMQRRVDRKEYVNLFSNKIILGSLNAEDSARLGELERRLEFDDIMHYRALARAFAKKSQASTPKSYGGWVMSWLGFRESAKSDLVKANPELVRRFVRASVRSWEEAKKNPGAAVDAALKVKPDLNRQSTLDQMLVDFELLDSKNAKGRIGYGAQADWDQTLGILKAYRDLKTDSPWTAFHTNEFVP